MQTKPVKFCNYCGRYVHTEAACYKQAEAAKPRTQSKSTQKFQIFKKEDAAPV